jgi:hypothetical protein
MLLFIYIYLVDSNKDVTKTNLVRLMGLLLWLSSALVALASRIHNVSKKHEFN